MKITELLNEIAGAFPSPSTREKWAKDAAASNAAEAKRQAALKAQADAQRLATNAPIVDRQNKINYHGANAPKPTNATWDGDSDFLELDGTKYAKASRMPIPGGEAPDMKLISTQEGWQVYIWTRNSLKGVVGRYFYPAANPNTIQEGWFDSKPKVDWNKRAKELFAKGLNEQQVLQQLVKEGCPPNQAPVYVQAGQLEEAPIDATGDPNDPMIYGHEKANPMSLKGRIQQARNQLKELANMAESDDLGVWQSICVKAKGGMFMGLEQNLEQIRHGISELAAKRKKGGVASRGIDKNINEFAIGDDGGEENTLRKYARMWYSGDDAVQQKVEQVLDRMGWEIGEIDTEEGGAFVVQSGDEHGRSYIGFAPADLTEGLKDPKDNPCWKGYKPVGTKKKGGRTVPNCVPK